jgi:hypothetical protein
LAISSHVTALSPDRHFHNLIITIVTVANADKCGLLTAVCEPKKGGEHLNKKHA